MGFGIKRQSRHLRWAGFLFFADFVLVWLSFLAGIFIRFEEISWDKLGDYGPGIGFASIVLPSVLYIGGIYSPRKVPWDWIRHSRTLVVGVLAVLATVLATGSLVYTSRIGRGVLLASMLILVCMLILRHTLAVARRKQLVNSFLCLVASAADERVAEKIFQYWGARAKTFGIVLGRGYRPSSALPVIGSISEVGSREEGGFDVVLVRDSHFQDSEMALFLRGLRYKGSEILPLSDACEDIYHAVPIEAITDAWLFRASTQSQLFYIRKLKRFSDVFLALFFLILLSPFLAFGVMAVRLSSPGPVIFTQRRAGRLGRPITVYKLRTMHVRPETGAKWATEEKDRIFPLGRFLRAVRIDEIPQLINVLRGEMSFVGPRPEQISIVEELSRVIPFYRERLLIQPGITGWAQVNYPYGASVPDAARKLEYDLYYMKHMGIFLDFFILLETVKIILCGGLREGDDAYLDFRGQMEGLEVGGGSEDTGGRQDRGNREDRPLAKDSEPAVGGHP